MRRTGSLPLASAHACAALVLSGHDADGAVRVMQAVRWLDRALVESGEPPWEDHIMATDGRGHIEIALKELHGITGPWVAEARECLIQAREVLGPEPAPDPRLDWLLRRAHDHLQAARDHSDDLSERLQLLLPMTRLTPAGSRSAGELPETTVADHLAEALTAIDAAIPLVGADPRLYGIRLAVARLLARRTGDDGSP